MKKAIAKEAVAKVADSAGEYIAKSRTIDMDTDGNQAVGEDIAGLQDTVRTHDIVIFTIGALLLCMSFLVFGYLLGDLVSFLEKNGDVSGLFKAAWVMSYSAPLAGVFMDVMDLMDMKVEIVNENLDMNETFNMRQDVQCKILRSR